MEKKIERVPYISKWYKEELDWSQLFKFDFKDEPMTEKTAKELNNCFKNVYLDKGAGSYFDVNNCMWNDKSEYTYSTTTNDRKIWLDHGYPANNFKPIGPILKFEHHLTQQDVDYLIELLHLTHLDVKAIKNVPSREKDAIDRLLIITNYIRNSLGVRDKAQEKQLEELIEQSKPKKSYEGTLGEHKKELKSLYQTMDLCGLEHIKDFVNRKFFYSITLTPIKQKLGIDFISDFIKACEKCED